MRAAESIRDKNEEREMTNSLRIFSPDGRLVWNSPNAVAQTPVPNHVFEQVHLGNSLHKTAETLDGRWSVRQLFVPIPRKGPVRHVLQAEASLLLYRETLIGLVILLTLGSGTILFVAWIGSGWLAKKVMTPIEVLSTGAETISEADLGKRLTLDSPYEEFRRLTQAFNSVTDRFQRSGETQRRFCDIAAHEMKTPLTILQGNLDVALMKVRTTEEYREALLNNLEQVGRLIALTRSLLTLANFTSGKPPVHLVPLALEPMIQGLVEELTLLADDRHITMSFESQSIPPILGDAQWLNQALINLLDNALHYTPTGGAVTIRLQVVGNDVAVAVEDTGHGIEPGASSSSLRAVLSDRLGKGEGCRRYRTWAAYRQGNRRSPRRNRFGHKPSREGLNFYSTFASLNEPDDSCIVCQGSKSSSPFSAKFQGFDPSAR